MTNSDGRSYLATRWSMLDQLGKPSADEAWRWFIDRYRPFASSVLAKILGARGRARDVDAAAEEFWAYLFSSEVFRAADRDRRFRSFLAGTLRNFARDYCRKHGQHISSDDESGPEPTTTDALPEDEELRIFAHQVLRLALQQLESKHPDNAQAVRWFYGIAHDQEDLTALKEPLPVSEIARRLEIKPNAVHQVLHRGRKRLRERIEAELRDTVLEAADLEGEITTILATLGADAPGLTAG